MRLAVHPAPPLYRNARSARANASNCGKRSRRRKCSAQNQSCVGTAAALEISRSTSFSRSFALITIGSKLAIVPRSPTASHSRQSSAHIFPWLHRSRRITRQSSGTASPPLISALVINVRPSTNHASSTPPPEIQTQFLVWYPSLRLCCSPIGRSVLSGMSIQIHRSNSLANVFRAQQDKSQRIDLVCFLFLTRLFSPNASTASVISCLTPQCTRRD